jgi:hypothetical protein
VETRAGGRGCDHVERLLSGDPPKAFGEFCRAFTEQMNKLRREHRVKASAAARKIADIDNGSRRSFNCRWRGSDPSRSSSVRCDGSKSERKRTEGLRPAIMPLAEDRPAAPRAAQLKSAFPALETAAGWSLVHRDGVTMPLGWDASISGSGAIVQRGRKREWQLHVRVARVVPT